MGFGLFELLVIVGIILLLAGGRRLPEVGSGLAKAIKAFKRSMRESEEIDVTPPRNDEGKSAASPGRRSETETGGKKAGRAS